MQSKGKKKKKKTVCLFYLKLLSLMKIRYADNRITLGDDSVLWRVIPKSIIMRLQSTVARNAVSEHQSGKYHATY